MKATKNLQSLNSDQLYDAVFGADLRNVNLLPLYLKMQSELPVFGTFYESAYMLYEDFIALDKNLELIFKGAYGDNKKFIYSLSIGTEFYLIETKTDPVTPSFSSNSRDNVIEQSFKSNFRKEYKYFLSLSLIGNVETSKFIDKFEAALRSVTELNTEISTKGKVYLISQSPNAGFYLMPYTLNVANYSESIIDSNYNASFKPAYKKMVDFLKKPDESGLILLNGKPGTGKTSFIQHLVNMADNLSRKIIILSTTFTSVLGDSSFTRFALSQLLDSILIIEDGESVLKAREVNPNPLAVSNILNITDGILGNLLQLKIVITLNSLYNIDQALFRKGRLKARYTFENLDSEKATALSAKLGINKKYTSPISLADVYNEGETVEFNNQTKSIGFYGK